MRPYKPVGNTKTTKRKTKKQKAKDAAGGVKNSMVKAKSTALKVGKRKLNKAEKDEVDGLLERTAVTNGTVAETPQVTVTPTASKKAVAKKGIQIKKLKSLVSLNSYEPMKEEAVTPRRSARLTSSASTTNGHDQSAPVNDVSMAVSEAEEAVERPSTKVGFLTKTMSRIWKLPAEATTGVAYSEVNGSEESVDPVTTNGHEERKKSCIIS